MSVSLTFSSTLNLQPPTFSTVLVCEREPYWAPELQRRFQQSGVTVRGCRKWSEFEELSRPYAEVVQIVDLEETAADCLAGLGRRLRDPRSRPLIVLASPRFAEWEWILREAGVQAFFSEHLSGEELARCCRRWLGDAGRL